MIQSGGDGNVGIGINNPSRPFQLRGSNSVLQIDRDTKDPGFGVTRYSPGFGEVWKSFFFYTEGTSPNVGRFIIADWGTSVKGLSTPRFVIGNTGNIGLGGELNPAYPLEINGNSSIGIQYDGPQGGSFAGTYMNGGLPFYGYKRNDIVLAYHYVDASNTWRLFNNGARLSVASNGNVDVATNLQVGNNLGVNGNIGIGIAPIYKLHVESDNQLGFLLQGGDSVWGGMYIDASNGGKPYYGYRANGITRGWTYIEDDDNSWRVNVANADRLTVKTSGDVGIGVDNPLARLDLVDTGWQLHMDNTNTGGEDWYVGASADAWNVGGGKFVISPNSNSSSANLVITNDGYVGINDPNPNTPLSVGTTSGEGSRIEFGSSEYIQDDGSFKILVNGDLVTSFSGDDLGNSDEPWNDVFISGSVVNTSDKRAKDNIKSLKSALDKVLQLKPVTYTFKNVEDKELRTGLIAQDVQKIIPEVVYDPRNDLERTEENGIQPASTDPNALLGIKYTELIPYLIGALQEQEEVIAKMQKEINILKSREQYVGFDDFDEAKLYQNHPNPFNQDTEIRIFLPENVNAATLYIYDMQGQELNRIQVSGRGDTAVTLEAGYLNSGMYLYSLIADGKEVGTHRMILTK